MTTAYSREFFAGHADGSLASARRALPRVRELVNPRSIADIGCGIGTWLNVWTELGISEVTGIDGSYINKDRLLVPSESFIQADLSQIADPATRPSIPHSTRASRRHRFDLAMSLEVAEHLPSSAAEHLVSFLCELAPVVLFSAAIPYQGGTEHINEKLASWWAQLFANRGYAAIDAIRPAIWHDRDVEWWYRQNTLLYASPEALAANPKLRTARERTHDGALDLIHPAHYRRLVRWAIAGGKGEGSPDALNAIQQGVPRLANQP